jgi:light-regulated signal transduction histidine kinase (bacteriophytochrome)
MPENQTEATPPAITASNVDISNCDREQIHLVNAIQPHGALLVLEEPSLRIVQASANSASFLGLPTDSLLGQTIDALLGKANTEKLKTILAEHDLTNILDRLMTLPKLPHLDQWFNVFGNRTDGFLVLEFERASPSSQEQERVGLYQFRDFIQRLQRTPSLAVFLDVAIEQIRHFTGFERVMAYRFDLDGSGEVVAEAKAPDLEAYLGLHYPASDIPAPARRLFALSPLRHLPNVDYEPVPILSYAAKPLTPEVSMGINPSPSPLGGEGFRERGIGLITNGLPSHQPSQNPLPQPLPLRGGGENRKPLSPEGRGVGERGLTVQDNYSIPEPQPVDLSHSFLRSVSVMYTGYLRNMGVKSTMVLPLLKNGHLWGLISCMNHSAPLYLHYEQRVPVELLTQMLSLMMGDREDLDQYAYRTSLDIVLGKLVSLMGREEGFHQALTADQTNLLTTLDADGVALIADGKLSTLGNTPSESNISLLADWLGQQEAAVFASHRMLDDFPATRDFLDTASGVLSVRLSRAGSDRIIWFRPEMLHDVHWAGDPNKPVEISTIDNEIRLQPRTSFALWKETVHGQSRPWLDCEIDYVTRLRRAIFDVIVERAKLLARTNAELERSNQELDSFAYAASHDLKEPLRGIHNFAEFLKGEEGINLSERGLKRIETILRLSGRMDNMLESLLQYSRVGRNALDMQAQSINKIVEQVAELILQVMPEKNITIDIQPFLPAIQCDRVRVTMVFHNLIMNAIKYNDKDHKIIKIGCDPSTIPVVFFVRDNGIGIAPNHHEQIFQLFRRLHGRDDFGGGSGAGLTIVKKAIQRHGGHIWLESTLGSGSTFFFTLSSENNAESERL